jgi:phenylacetate-coenzyme A ligase PaaK-like adenylate-forming protein
MTLNLSDRIFTVSTQDEFLEAALGIFRFQSAENPVYRKFIEALGRDPREIRSLDEIPFLPVEFFKTHEVTSSGKQADEVFESSRTSGSQFSRHYVTDRKLYEESFLRAFRIFYGNPEDYFIAALLPSYMERKNSSLIYMMNDLIKRSRDSRSGFFRDDTEKLVKLLHEAADAGRKALLMGVSFALYDLAEKNSPDLSGVIVMETGGMKGRRKEIIRGELHDFLTAKFNVPEIHSEYGMTELLSQAYSKGKGIFYCPPWMKVLIRDPYDPLSIISEPGRTGGINIIDLANLYSCSFIATGDLGKLHEDGGFEVLGRFDNSDIRGCNLMME